LHLSTSTSRFHSNLDSFVEREGVDRLDLIKIDVDGHEYPVLKGGLRTLTGFRPVLVIEMSPYVHAEQGHSFGALVALLRNSSSSEVFARGIGRWQDGEDQGENLFGLNSVEFRAPRRYFPPLKDQHQQGQRQDGCERHSHSNRPVPSSYKLYLSARETGRYWQQHLPSFLLRLESNDLSIQLCLPGRISKQLYSEQERTR